MLSLVVSESTELVIVVYMIQLPANCEAKDKSPQVSSRKIMRIRIGRGVRHSLNLGYQLPNCSHFRFRSLHGRSKVAEV